MIRAGLTLLLTACVPRGAIEDAMDRDNDGYVAWQLDGDDCDDSDPTVRPGLDEVCDNDKDDDCDGNVDDDGVGSVNWYPDADGDGFGIDTPTSACVQPEGHLADLEAGIDCDDAEDDANPGEPEVCGNDRDDDCDGNTDDAGLGSPTWYPDLDGDAYATNNPVQTCGRPPNYVGTLGLIDCDDGNPDAHPGAAETWYDGVDEDCLGGDDYDQDGDEFASEAHGEGPDCDDTDDAVHPDATEICFNNADDNCDDQVDDSGLGAATWYPDLDEDGFATNNPVQACTRPTKHVSTLGTVDCNDTNSTIRPDATEIWYDGTDQNCNGDDDYDRDADSFRALGQIAGGTDCEDTLPAVNPDADEVCDNGLDDDCDTTANGCELLGTHAIAAITSSTISQTSPALGSFGQEPAIVDASGDGLQDVVAGGYGGSVWVFKSPIPATVTASSGRYAEFRTSTNAWRSAAVGDFNGDGVPDMALGRYEAKDARIFYGSLSGYFTEADADVVITDPATGSSRFGESITAVPDVDSDGHDELIVGATGVTSLQDPNPRCYVFDGPYAASWTVANRIGRLNGRADFDGTCWLSRPSALAGASPGLLVVAHGDENYTGTVSLFTPSTMVGERSVQDNGVIVGVEPAALEGYSVAQADFDGDGLTDLAVGAPSTGNDYQGAVYVVSGPFSTWAPKLLSDAYWTLSSSVAGGQLGSRLAALDFDGDGHVDLAVGSTMATGQIRIFYGPLVAGSFGPADADVQIDGATRFFGAGDIDNDGRDDLAVVQSTTLRVIRGRGR